MKKRKLTSYALLLTLFVNLLSGMSSFAAPAEAAMDDSKVLDLKFEDNLDDSSTNHIAANWNGTAPTYVPGIVGKAISFNGTNNYIDLGTSSLLQPKNLTVSFWVKPDATMTGEQLITWFKPNKTWNGNGWYLTSLSDSVPLKLSTGTGVQESI